MHNPAQFQMPLPPLPPGAPRGALKPAKSTRVMNLEKKRAEERASKLQPGQPQSVFPKQTSGAKGVSKQTARAARASAAIFALLSLATFLTNPLSNFGYTGSEVILYNNNNHLDAVRGGEEDLTFSTGRVLLALDDGGVGGRGIAELSSFEETIDALFLEDSNEPRIWNKTCVEQIEVRKLCFLYVSVCA